MKFNITKFFNKKNEITPNEKPSDGQKVQNDGIFTNIFNKNKDIDAHVFDTFNYDKAVKALFPRSILQVRDADTGKFAMDDDNFPHIANAGSTGQYGYNPMANDRIPEKIMRYYEDHYFIGWSACAALSQHEFISRACSIPGEDAIAVGYSLSFNSNHDSGKDIDDTQSMVKESNSVYDINEVCRKLDFNKKVFGCGLAVPSFEGDNVDMENPMNLDASMKNVKYLGWKVIDPYWVTPVFDDRSISDPSYKDYFVPTWWRLTNGKRIHKSWCIFVVNTIVPDIFKPTYYYGGIPLTQMIYERVYAADKVANEAPQLALTKRLLVVDANIQKMVANPSAALKIMNALSFGRDNWGVFFKNPGTNVSQIDTVLSEFNQMIMTQYQLVASIAQIPATKLLKTVPTGFKSTGDYEWKDYAQTINAIQTNEFKPLLEKHYNILWKIKSGKNEGLTISFHPVDAPSLMEMARINEKNSKILQGSVKAGILTPNEARKAINADSTSPMKSIRLEDNADGEKLTPSNMPEIESVTKENVIK